MSALTVKNLRKSFQVGFIPKEREVLKGVSFQVEKGRVTGFLGRNGAGKTTTLKCVLGLAFPSAGEIKFFGQNDLTEEVKRRVGFLPEHPYFYEYLTGIEFLRFYGKISMRVPEDALEKKITNLLERVGLTHAGDVALRHYSKGMLQKIGFAQAVIHDPELLILDEPMAGLDPDGRIDISVMIREYANAGAAVFFSSHLLHDAEKLCDDLVILKGGQVVFNGSTQEFVNKSNLEDAFRAL